LTLDPGSGMENSDPGFGINVPDPQPGQHFNISNILCKRKFKIFLNLDDRLQNIKKLDAAGIKR
jgi:hypothetical protein